jgi:hypothetical protein
MWGTQPAVELGSGIVRLVMLMLAVGSSVRQHQQQQQHCCAPCVSGIALLNLDELRHFFFFTTTFTLFHSFAVQRTRGLHQARSMQKASHKVRYTVPQKELDDDFCRMMQAAAVQTARLEEEARRAFAAVRWSCRRTSTRHAATRRATAAATANEEATATRRATATKKANAAKKAAVEKAVGEKAAVERAAAENTLVKTEMTTVAALGKDAVVASFQCSVCLGTGWAHWSQTDIGPCLLCTNQFNTTAPFF